MTFLQKKKVKVKPLTRLYKELPEYFYMIDDVVLEPNLTLRELFQDYDFRLYYTYYGARKILEHVSKVLAKILDRPSWYFQILGGVEIKSKPISVLDYFLAKDKLKYVELIYPVKITALETKSGEYVLVVTLDRDWRYKLEEMMLELLQKEWQ